jgi:hypothetical protein
VVVVVKRTSSCRGECDPWQSRTMMRNCNVQYTFLERRRNMHDNYDSKVGSMSIGVGRLNNNQVVICLTD